MHGPSCQHGSVTTAARRTATGDWLNSSRLIPTTRSAYARVSAWGGDTNQAVTEYERYLKTHPENRDAWIELAKTESWRGNYGAALSALKTYKTQFGETTAYAQTYAAVMPAAAIRDGR
jgi:cytochrome c-type biogenesis protein CcmH/NrfG